MFVAGIDGGGTHTRLELRDMDNRLLERKEFGPFNLNSIGEAGFTRLLEQLFAACGDLSQCRSLCFGAAGISNPRMAVLIRQALAGTAFSGKWTLLGDQQIALRGAMDTPGIALIAGTGSICFGQNAQGQTARCGGYGHLLDDEGSGYALGRDVLRAAIRTLDGRPGSQAITQAVCRQVGSSQPQDLVQLVYGPGADKSTIAAFAPIALLLAREGDQQALEILSRGAAELALLVSAAQDKLQMRPCPVALLGGLLQHDNPYRQRVAAALAPLGTAIAPAHDALWGAAQIAWEQLQAPPHP